MLVAKRRFRVYNCTSASADDTGNRENNNVGPKTDLEQVTPLFIRPQYSLYHAQRASHCLPNVFCNHGDTLFTTSSGASYGTQ